MQNSISKTSCPLRTTIRVHRSILLAVS